MKITSPLFHLVLFFILAGAASVGAAQQAPSASPSQSPAQTTPAPQVEDISGMYTFLREGEFVQINVEDGNVVTGFLSRYGDSEDEKGAFLDQFFSKAAFDGKRISFTTKPVHSTWFEFSGDVERGPGKTPKDEAYRLIRGKLTQYTTDKSGRPSAKSRDLEMKSFPQDFEEQTAPPKQD